MSHIFKLNCIHLKRSKILAFRFATHNHKNNLPSLILDPSSNSTPPPLPPSKAARGGGAVVLQQIRIKDWPTKILINLVIQ